MVCAHSLEGFSTPVTMVTCPLLCAYGHDTRALLLRVRMCLSAKTISFVRIRPMTRAPPPD
jgi:hypothetical protein